MTIEQILEMKQERALITNSIRALMNYYFLSFDINHKVSNHYTLVIESEEGEIYSSDTWGVS